MKGSTLTAIDEKEKIWRYGRKLITLFFDEVNDLAGIAFGLIELPLCNLLF